MTTHTNLLHWLPQPKFEDGDIVRDSNLSIKNGGNCDQGKRVRFVNCNLKGRTTTMEQLHEDGNAIGDIADNVEEPFTIVNKAIADKAKVVLSALMTSSEIPNEKLVQLEQLTAMCESVAGTSSTLGEAATAITTELINDLNTCGASDVAKIVESALRDIQSINGGNV